jgi:hypothetical protein
LLGGVQPAIHGGRPGVGQLVDLAIAFEHQVVEMCGVVKHVRKQPWSSVVGIEFEHGPRPT